MINNFIFLLPERPRKHYVFKAFAKKKVLILGQ
jgi:hypothetical protein